MLMWVWVSGYECSNVSILLHFSLRLSLNKLTWLYLLLRLALYSLLSSFLAESTFGFVRCPVVSSHSHLLPLPFRVSLLSYTVRSTIIHGFLSAGFALLDELLMWSWLSRRPWLLRRCGIERYLGDRLFNESENWPSRRSGRGLLYYCRITFDVSEEKGFGGWFAVPGCALCRLLLNASKHIRVKRLLLCSSAFLTRSLLFR